MNCKVVITHTASRLPQVPAVWALINATAIRLADYLAFARQHPQTLRNLREAHEYEQASLHSLFADRRVASGPFRGMIYPSFESCGSQITPTILAAFDDRHVITKIYSQDEFFRPHQYADERTGGLPFAERRALMTEKRGPMIWLFCRSRAGSR